MKKEDRTIALFGLFGSSNLGNEATLAAFLQHLRRRVPDVRILMIAPRRSAGDRTNGLRWLDWDPMPIEPLFWRIKPGWLQRFAVSVATTISEPFRRRRAARLLLGVQALFMPGTGVVDDFGQSFLDLPLHLDRWTAAATTVGARVIFCSIGASTVQSGLSRHLFLRSLRRAAYCSFRDRASRENARALGYSGTLVVPDLAFSLQCAPSLSKQDTWPPDTIGIGVMGYFGWNLNRDDGKRVYLAYIAQVQALIERLVQRGCRVRLLIGDTSADARAARDLTAVSATFGDTRFIAAPIENYRDLINEIAQCDLVVATRYHNVLFSLMAAKPTISIGYSDKNDALMRSMGHEAFCHSIETFEAGAVVAQIAAIAALERSPGAELRARADQVRDQVIEQFETIFAAEFTECERSSRSAR